MTTKTLSTYVTSYTLAAQYDTLSITASGSIGAGGLTLNHVSTLQNSGNIRATGHDGVHATAAMEMVNGAASTIAGYSGVFDQVSGTILNLGVIAGQSRYGNGVFLVGGGQVTNGAAGGPTASIQGQNVGVLAGAAASVVNYGAIVGVNSEGVYLEKGGTLVNGASAGASASVVGSNVAVGAAGSSATVTNFGTLSCSSLAGGKAVDLTAGGRVINAAGGVIHADYGVFASGAPVTVVNHGALSGRITAIDLQAAGAVTNAAEGTITGGVYLYAGGSVSNLGAIQGSVFLSYGSLTNGAASDTGAAIVGLSVGVVAVGGADRLVNFATIEGATSSSGGLGVKLAGDETLVNGSSTDSAALIDAWTGVTTTLGGDTVRNYGVIEGAGGVALDFQTGGDTLIAEAGCAFEGQVQGGGGTLVLDDGRGSVAQMFGPGGMIVYGSMSATVFEDFATLSIGKRARFTAVGAASVGAADTLVVAGSFTAAGSLANAGLVEVAGGAASFAGAVTGSGFAQIAGGMLVFHKAFDEAVAFTGASGTLTLAQSQAYGATISGFSKTGATSLDLLDIGFTGSGEATFSGTQTGGVLTVTDGTHTARINLAGDYRSGAFIASSDGHGGTIVVDPKTRAVLSTAPRQPPSTHPLVSAMASLGAPGAGFVSRPNETATLGTRLLAGPRVMVD